MMIVSRDNDSTIESKCTIKIEKTKHGNQSPKANYKNRVDYVNSYSFGGMHTILYIWNKVMKAISFRINTPSKAFKLIDEPKIQCFPRIQNYNTEFESNESDNSDDRPNSWEAHLHIADAHYKSKRSLNETHSLDVQDSSEYSLVEGQAETILKHTRLSSHKKIQDWPEVRLTNVSHHSFQSGFNRIFNCFQIEKRRFIPKSSIFTIFSHGKLLFIFIFVFLLLSICIDFTSAHNCFSVEEDDPSVCSSHGDCISENTCQCTIGYGGDMCEKFRCHDKNEDEAGVCSGRGTCSGPNTCSCLDSNSWGGSNCDVPLCNMILASNPLVCNGAGTCTAPDICECANLFPGTSFGNSGPFCENSYCGSESAGDVNVCNGRGICTFDPTTKINYCVCNSGYANGPLGTCELTTCFGKLSNSPSVCSGVEGAVCSQPDTCICPPGYGGNQCQDIYCGIYRHDDSLVCSSKGDCIGPNNCACDLGYRSGSDPSLCDLKVCNGLDSDSINICNGHGACNPSDTTPDVCSCSTGYTGQYCEEWTCGGISRSDPSVCSGYGTCESRDTCVEPICFGIPASDNSVCSNRQGRCIDTDICYCELHEYQGEQCEIPVCNGTRSDSVDVCSGHGSCEAYDLCHCPSDNYIGLNCEVSLCNNIRSNLDHVCGGHGTCWPLETCTCDHGWLKPENDDFNCNIPTCFGISSFDPGVCNGRGNCVDLDTCQCTNIQYTGDKCEIEKCLTRELTCSGHGDCDLNHDKCECDVGWIGSDCSEFTCFGKVVTDSDVCNGHGTCTGLDTCSCTNWEWTGSQCSLPGCYGKSNQDVTVCAGRGECVELNECQCYSFLSGYMNSKCENPGCFGALDTNVCSNHGECVSSDHCICDTNYFGYQCQFHSCFGISSGNESVCSNHGICSSMNHCTCDSGYTGLECEYATCFGVVGSSVVSCHGHGDCIQPDPNPICNCTNHEEWSGDSCQLPKCFGILANNNSVCSARGECVSHQECVCTDPYSNGLKCENWICDGISAEDPLVCHGHGICDKPNLCTCEEGYDPPFCEYHFCYGTLSNDAGVCSGHGLCADIDKCSCDVNWTGAQCEYYTCGAPHPEQILCHYQGVCTTDTTCLCNPDYYGNQCDKHITQCRDDVHNNFHYLADNCTSCLERTESCISFIGNFTLSLIDIVGVYKVPNRVAILVDCGTVISPASLSQLGADPECRWSSLEDDLFKITLGIGHTVTEMTALSFQLYPFSTDASFWSDNAIIFLEENMIVPFGPSVVYPRSRAPNLTWLYATTGTLSGFTLLICIFLCTTCAFISLFGCVKVWNYCCVNVKSIGSDSIADEENTLLMSIQEKANRSQEATLSEIDNEKDTKENNTPRGLNAYFSDPTWNNESFLRKVEDTTLTPKNQNDKEDEVFSNKLYRIINQEKQYLQNGKDDLETGVVPMSIIDKKSVGNSSFLWNEDLNSFVPARGYHSQGKDLSGSSILNKQIDTFSSNQMRPMKFDKIDFMDQEDSQMEGGTIPFSALMSYEETGMSKHAGQLNTLDFHSEDSDITEYSNASGVSIPGQMIDY